VIFSLQVSWTKICMHFLSLPNVPHTPPISFSLIRSPYPYATRSRNYEASMQSSLYNLSYAFILLAGAGTFNPTAQVNVVSWGGVRLSPLGTSVTNWPIVPNPDDMWWWMWSSRWNENWPLCPPQIPHDLTWARTRAATVGSRRLTAWAMAMKTYAEVDVYSFMYSYIRQQMNVTGYLHDPATLTLGTL
jgi:hypothetical protein